MKNIKLILVLGFSALALGACGGKNDAPATSTASVCGVGSVNTAYGCLPQGNCPANTASYNNTCTPATAVNNGYGTPNYGTTCTVAGQVNTQYGCVVQAPCPTGFGLYNNNCVPVVANTGTNTGYNTGYNTGNNCASGTYPTQVGCLPQGPCYTGQVFYNNQCYQYYSGSNSGAYTGFQFNLGF